MAVFWSFYLPFDTISPKMVERHHQAVYNKVMKVHFHHPLGAT